LVTFAKASENTTGTAKEEGGKPKTQDDKAPAIKAPSRSGGDAPVRKPGTAKPTGKKQPPRGNREPVQQTPSAGTGGRLTKWISDFLDL
jgi:hypothetical protein